MKNTQVAGIEMNQSLGADETLREAVTMFESQNPSRRAVKATFSWAYAGDRTGRWVGISVEHVAR